MNVWICAVSTNTCADISELFTPVAVDRAGNVYVAFIDYISTLHPAYDVYLARSTGGGGTWDGKADGSGTAVLVSGASGTHYIPNLVAGDAGRVAVVYTDLATAPAKERLRNLQRIRGQPDLGQRHGQLVPGRRPHLGQRRDRGQGTG